MTTETLLLLILIVFLIGMFPAWPYSRSWGYRPTAVLGILLVVFLIWAIAGDRPLFRNSGGNIQEAVEEVGQDMKAAGCDAADSIKDVVQ